MNQSIPARRALLAIASVLVLCLSACGSDDTAIEDPAFVEVTAASLTPGDDVPAPTGDVVLTVGGNISNTNVGDTLQFDMEGLESLGLIEYSVDDYQAEGRVASFTGVLASAVLEIAGASADSTSLRTVALNDYEVEIPTVDVTELPVMIATKVDGARMPVDAYGPTRVIYPSSSFDLDEAVYGPRWIWQLALIEVG